MVSCNTVRIHARKLTDDSLVYDVDAIDKLGGTILAKTPMVSESDAIVFAEAFRDLIVRHSMEAMNDRIAFLSSDGTLIGNA